MNATEKWLFCPKVQNRINAFLVLLSGCGKETKYVDEIEAYVTGIENIVLPSEAMA